MDVDADQLEFAQFTKLADDLAEVVVAEGVEMDLAMVAQYHDWLRTHLASPCLVLINKINRYSYTFEAQQQIGTIPEIKAIAFLTYSAVSDLTTEALAELPRSRRWNARIFHDRDDALRWLTAQRD